MAKALGAESMEEAMAIISAASIQKDDVDELMMEQMMIELQKEN